jgi:hypothetical protein
MDGQKFDITKGLYDEEVKRNVFPSELINCNCIMRLVFDPEQVNDDE